MTIRLEIADRVARVTIDRPEVLNALDAEAEEALEAVWQQLEADRDVHAVVLTGAGERAFCVGADLKAGGRSGLEYWAMARPAGFGGLALRTTLDIPVIARVNGHVLGGGFEMISAAIWSSPRRKPVSDCRSRGSGFCRSTAAWCCCSARCRSARQ